ncbi:hypothetical protein HYU13_05040 [Candidatus Woesearchaeota archaeon]|nr:hypothetical protein [Candidatus Woesearchaeota archaeon]
MIIMDEMEQRSLDIFTRNVDANLDLVKAALKAGKLKFALEGTREISLLGKAAEEQTRGKGEKVEIPGPRGQIITFENAPNMPLLDRKVSIAKRALKLCGNLIRSSKLTLK